MIKKLNDGGIPGRSPSECEDNNEESVTEDEHDNNQLRKMCRMRFLSNSDEETESRGQLSFEKLLENITIGHT